MNTKNSEEIPVNWFIGVFVHQRFGLPFLTLLNIIQVNQSAKEPTNSSVELFPSAARVYLFKKLFSITNKNNFPRKTYFIVLLKERRVQI